MHCGSNYLNLVLKYIYFSFSRSASIPLVFAVAKLNMAVLPKKTCFSLVVTLNTIGKNAPD